MALEFERSASWRAKLAREANPEADRVVQDPVRVMSIVPPPPTKAIPSTSKALPKRPNQAAMPTTKGSSSHLNASQADSEPHPKGVKKNRRRKRSSQRKGGSNAVETSVPPAGVPEELVSVEPLSPRNDLAPHAGHPSTKRPASVLSSSVPPTKRRKTNGGNMAAVPANVTELCANETESCDIIPNVEVQPETDAKRILRLEDKLSACKVLIKHLRNRPALRSAMRHLESSGQAAFTDLDYKLLSLSYDHASEDLSDVAQATLHFAQCISRSPHSLQTHRNAMICAYSSAQQSRSRPASVILSATFRSSRQQYKATSVPVLKGMEMLNEEMDNIYSSILAQLRPEGEELHDNATNGVKDTWSGLSSRVVISM
ncbi:hypothetical protein DFJ77DRAFT_508663 [Powellomyces hirtus]|nr:hypothetical protein DFJ77DRAFT_508663 [Powellomyces hirtus]